MLLLFLAYTVVGYCRTAFGNFSFGLEVDVFVSDVGGGHRFSVSDPWDFMPTRKIRGLRDRQNYRSQGIWLCRSRMRGLRL